MERDVFVWWRFVILFLTAMGGIGGLSCEIDRWSNFFCVTSRGEAGGGSGRGIIRGNGRRSNHHDDTSPFNSRDIAQMLVGCNGTKITGC